MCVHYRALELTALGRPTPTYRSSKSVHPPCLMLSTCGDGCALSECCPRRFLAASFPEREILNSVGGGRWAVGGGGLISAWCVLSLLLGRRLASAATDFSTDPSMKISRLFSIRIRQEVSESLASAYFFPSPLSLSLPPATPDVDLLLLRRIHSACVEADTQTEPLTDRSLLYLSFVSFPSPLSVRQRDKWRRTPLHRAAKEGYKEVVAALLSGGAEVNAPVGGGKGEKTRCSLPCFSETDGVLSVTSVGGPRRIQRAGQGRAGQPSAHETHLNHSQLQQ